MNQTDVITDFAELLALEPVGPDHFTARTPGEGGHLFGGLTFGLAARAAALTVEPDRDLYAATCQYVGAGTGGLGLEIEVERVRDGRKLSLRRVRVMTGGRLLFSCDAWFAPDEAGIDWQPLTPPNDRADAVTPSVPLLSLGLDPLELLSLRSPTDAEALRIHPYWACSRHPVGEDRALNLGVLAFISDLCTVGLVAAPGTASGGTASGGTASGFTTTLNHTLWVHRPFTVDQWLRVDGQPASIHGNRGLATGSIHAQDGSLVASFSQESMRR